MVQQDWLFFMQLLMGILMLAALQKLIELQKKIDEITKEVMGYISYVTNDMEEEQEKAKGMVAVENRSDKEEAQSRLIQAVLGDYFK